MSALVDRIREQARALGFSQVGIAPAEPPASAPTFAKWLQAGMAGSMGYLVKDPDRRMDPRRYWPEARSVIALSLSYAPLTPDREAGPLEGRVARYARGDDYHDVLKGRLHALGRFIVQEAPGAHYIPVVDTSAVLERAHAVRAGLGWFGKNSMLLDRQQGSYTVLGFVLVDLELPPDSPVTDHCGSCRRCIDACPTQAIVAPGVVDARRCISYLTIELRGSMPVGLRSRLDGWVFGCDVCQEVCPWVRHAAGSVAGKPEESGPLAAKAGREALSLAALALDTRESFAARWKGSPVKRTKRSGMARNAAVLLGNAPDREGATDILAQAVQHDEPVVRAHAAWALGKQGGRVARAALEAAAAREPDAEASAEIDAALEGRWLEGR